MMKKVAPGLVIMAGILWGSMGIFVRRFEEYGLESLDIVAVRAITTTLILFSFFMFFDRSLFKIKMKDLWCFLGTGILSIVFFNYCYFKAITMTSLAVAAVLLYTAPAFVMVLSYFLFHEKFTGRKICALVLTFIGCVFVTGLIGSSQGLGGKGILIGIGAGFGYALYSIFGRFALDKGYSSFTISFYTFFIAALGVLPVCNFEKIIRISHLGIKMIGWALLFGFLSTVLAFILYTMGLKNMDNGKAAILASVEPVAAMLIGVLVYGETLSVGEMFGIFLVLGAIVLCNLKSKNKEE